MPAPAFQTLLQMATGNNIKISYEYYDINVGSTVYHTPRHGFAAIWITTISVMQARMECGFFSIGCMNACMGNTVIMSAKMYIYVFINDGR